VSATQNAGIRLITIAYLLAALRNKKGLFSETQQVITDELSNLLGDRIPWCDANSANLTCMKLERYLSTQDQFIDIVFILHSVMMQDLM
jgi:hypothetical protein